jgi:rhodanese-related sulfurtransferase
MPKFIEREDVQRLVRAGAQLVEVLGPSEYAEMHLPGAVNIPLARIDAQAPDRLRKDDPVIVYCNDYQ